MNEKQRSESKQMAEFAGDFKPIGVLARSPSTLAHAMRSVSITVFLFGRGFFIKTTNASISSFSLHID
jgi:hypothetical protein